MEGSTRRNKLNFSELAFHNVDQYLTIDSRIRDVIEDYQCLRKEKCTDTVGKFKRSEALPPNSVIFRQNTLLRNLTELNVKLKKEKEQCDRNDLIRRSILEEVTKKTEDLVRRHQAAEQAYSSVLKEKESHIEVVNEFRKEIKNYQATVKRYIICGTAIQEISSIMDETIKENKCYPQFVKSLARNESGDVLGEFCTEFEKVESMKVYVKSLLDEALSKIEKSRLNMQNTKNHYLGELNFTLGDLITSNGNMERAIIKSEKYSKALNLMSVVSVDQMTTLVRVLGLAQHMIERLIANKSIDRSYRKKTLAQQIDAIQKDYVKKKAILHECHKARARREKKKVFMLQALDKEELLQAKMNRQQVRLDDLCRKKWEMLTLRQHELGLKKQKKRLHYVPPIEVDQIEDHYNPLEDRRVLLDLEEDTGRSGKFSIPDIEFEREGDDDINLAVYGSSESGMDRLDEYYERKTSLVTAEYDSMSLLSDSPTEDSQGSSSEELDRSKRLSSFSSSALL